jgi:hypothetical protein
MGQIERTDRCEARPVALPVGSDCHTHRGVTFCSKAAGSAAPRQRPCYLGPVMTVFDEIGFNAVPRAGEI